MIDYSTSLSNGSPTTTLSKRPMASGQFQRLGHLYNNYQYVRTLVLVVKWRKFYFCNTVFTFFVPLLLFAFQKEIVFLSARGRNLCSIVPGKAFLFNDKSFIVRSIYFQTFLTSKFIKNVISQIDLPSKRLPPLKLTFKMYYHIVHFSLTLLHFRFILRFSKLQR